MFWCTTAIVIFPTCRLTFPESNFPKYAFPALSHFLASGIDSMHTFNCFPLVFLLYTRDQRMQASTQLTSTHDAQLHTIHKYTRDQHMQKSTTNLRNTQLTTSATIRFLAIYIPPHEMSWSLFFQIHLCYLS